MVLDHYPTRHRVRQRGMDGVQDRGDARDGQRAALAKHDQRKEPADEREFGEQLCAHVAQPLRPNIAEQAA